MAAGAENPVTALVVLGLLLFGIFTSLVALASAVWLVVVAFQTSVGWGIGVWFCYPFGAFAFAVQHWKRARWAAIVHFLAFFASLATLGVAEVLDPTPPDDGERVIDSRPSPQP
jgi:hypothetical protein